MKYLLQIILILKCLDVTQGQVKIINKIPNILLSDSQNQNIDLHSYFSGINLTYEIQQNPSLRPSNLKMKFTEQTTEKILFSHNQEIIDIQVSEKPFSFNIYLDSLNQLHINSTQIQVIDLSQILLLDKQNFNDLKCYSIWFYNENNLLISCQFSLTKDQICDMIIIFKILYNDPKEQLNLKIQAKHLQCTFNEIEDQIVNCQKQNLAKDTNLIIRYCNDRQSSKKIEIWQIQFDDENKIFIQNINFISIIDINDYLPIKLMQKYQIQTFLPLNDLILAYDNLNKQIHFFSFKSNLLKYTNTETVFSSESGLQMFHQKNIGQKYGEQKDHVIFISNNIFEEFQVYFQNSEQEFKLINYKKYTNLPYKVNQNIYITLVSTCSSIVIVGEQDKNQVISYLWRNEPADMPDSIYWDSNQNIKINYYLIQSNNRQTNDYYKVAYDKENGQSIVLIVKLKKQILKLYCVSVSKNKLQNFTFNITAKNDQYKVQLPVNILIYKQEQMNLIPLKQGEIKIQYNSPFIDISLDDFVIGPDIHIKLLNHQKMLTIDQILQKSIKLDDILKIAGFDFQKQDFMSFLKDYQIFSISTNFFIISFLIEDKIIIIRCSMTLENQQKIWCQEYKNLIQLDVQQQEKFTSRKLEQAYIEIYEIDFQSKENPLKIYQKINKFNSCFRILYFEKNQITVCRPFATNNLELSFIQFSNDNLFEQITTVDKKEYKQILLDQEIEQIQFVKFYVQHSEKMILVLKCIDQIFLVGITELSTNKITLNLVKKIVLVQNSKIKSPVTKIFYFDKEDQLIIINYSKMMIYQYECGDLGNIYLFKQFSTSHLKLKPNDKFDQQDNNVISVQGNFTNKKQQNVQAIFYFSFFREISNQLIHIHEWENDSQYIFQRFQVLPSYHDSFNSILISENQLEYFTFNSQPNLKGYLSIQNYDQPSKTIKNQINIEFQNAFGYSIIAYIYLELNFQNLITYIDENEKKIINTKYSLQKQQKVLPIHTNYFKGPIESFKIQQIDDINLDNSERLVQLKNYLEKQIYNLNYFQTYQKYGSILDIVKINNIVSVLSEKYLRILNITEEFKDIFKLPVYLNYQKCTKIFPVSNEISLFLLCQKTSNDNAQIVWFKMNNQGRLVEINSIDTYYKLDQINFIKKFNQMFILVVSDSSSQQEDKLYFIQAEILIDKFTLKTLGKIESNIFKSSEKFKIIDFDAKQTFYKNLDNQKFIFLELFVTIGSNLYYGQIEIILPENKFSIVQTNQIIFEIKSQKIENNQILKDVIENFNPVSIKIIDSNNSLYQNLSQNQIILGLVQKQTVLISIIDIPNNKNYSRKNIGINLQGQIKKILLFQDRCYGTQESDIVISGDQFILIPCRLIGQNGIQLLHLFKIQKSKRLDNKEIALYQPVQIEKFPYKQKKLNIIIINNWAEICNETYVLISNKINYFILYKLSQNVTIQFNDQQLKNKIDSTEIKLRLSALNYLIQPYSDITIQLPKTVSKYTNAYSIHTRIFLGLIIAVVFIIFVFLFCCMYQSRKHKKENAILEKKKSFDYVFNEKEEIKNELKKEFIEKHKKFF